MSESIPSGRLSLRDTAFFFDVDGTLADIQPRPELVFIPGATHHALSRLQALGAAVAVVSGRPLVQLDTLLQPLTLPAAGVHGAERRSADGAEQALKLDDVMRVALEAELAAAVDRYPGLMVENKRIAFALHYRQAPELEADIRALVHALIERYPTLVVQPGKCVFELKPKGASKGEVIRTFLQEPPFAGKTPVFLGDDLTDEAGFEVVNALGGISIKVGEGETCAHYRLDSVAHVGTWLDDLLAHAASISEDQIERGGPK
ncbi:trehalose-phosphatase [Pseudomonas matsuisoli]|uniref:Trehalose 6-phosphate phosphatase n=1 Tax=Pseudomonas matsuisoli TaxID=1515666 RepID=A0A917V161_9PSED|nr:trehalose-phosphatase [Pseudomonas matsuisoli]GGK10202.1 trehalose 6-phosphate phosphatase [Pseudomonas matsuisoli]